MVEQYSTWGRTYVLYAASFSCLFCVLTFRLINLRLFLAYIVYSLVNTCHMKLPSAHRLSKQIFKSSFVKIFQRMRQMLSGPEKQMDKGYSYNPLQLRGAGFKTTCFRHDIGTML